MKNRIDDMPKEYALVPLNRDLELYNSSLYVYSISRNELMNLLSKLHIENKSILKQSKNFL